MFLWEPLCRIGLLLGNDQDCLLFSGTLSVLGKRKLTIRTGSVTPLYYFFFLSITKSQPRAGATVTGSCREKIFPPWKFLMKGAAMLS